MILFKLIFTILLVIPVIYLCYYLLNHCVDFIIASSNKKPKQASRPKQRMGETRRR